ncbi:hypothetical protein LRS10_09390 [Phenylobacterium sp. J426]|uniref:hypothetical protein n=1 Tax=Phenylobacterium sp. J426 TaxID=2898439 RepID=UPI00215171E6|nr:hypothetical protein [Phenylobacterium sp. J426]MCR5874356.1 hypothetical protein [Phenylobacterium sp. J426]
MVARRPLSEAPEFAAVLAAGEAAVQAKADAEAAAGTATSVAAELEPLATAVLDAETAAQGATTAKNAAEGLVSAALAAAEDKGTRAAWSATNIPSVFQTISTSGYYAHGDGGGALYRRVGAEPSHACKFQSADGAWWELSEPYPNDRQAGAKVDAVNYPAATIANGTGNMTVPGASFTSEDVGKKVIIPNTFGYIGTITAVTGDTTATVSPAASPGVAGVDCWIGTDDSAALQALIDYVDARGGGRASLTSGARIADDVTLADRVALIGDTDCSIGNPGIVGRTASIVISAGSDAPYVIGSDETVYGASLRKLHVIGAGPGRPDQIGVDVACFNGRYEDLSISRTGQQGFRTKDGAANAEIRRIQANFAFMGGVPEEIKAAVDIDGADHNIERVQGYCSNTGMSKSLTVTATQSAGVATYTSAAPHGIVVGDIVFMYGANQADYNDIKYVTAVPSSTTFQTIIASGAASPATGTITCDVIREVGVLMRGGNNWINEINAEQSDVGFVDLAVDISRVNAVRAMRNFGHGMITGEGQYGNCYALDNGLARDNTYDGFVGVPGSAGTLIAGGTLINPVARCGTYDPTKRHRYGFNYSASSEGAPLRRAKLVHPRSYDHQTGAIRQNAFSPQGVAFVSAVRRISSGATPNAEGTTRLLLEHASATDVTSFTGGVAGQELVVYGNSNVTLKHGTSLKLNTGADKVMAANRSYVFDAWPIGTSYAVVWVERG